MLFQLVRCQIALVAIFLGANVLLVPEPVIPGAGFDGTNQTLGTDTALRADKTGTDIALPNQSELCNITQTTDLHLIQTTDLPVNQTTDLPIIQPPPALKIEEMTEEDVFLYCANPAFVNSTFPTCPNPKLEPTPRFSTIAPIDFMADDADDKVSEPYRLLKIGEMTEEDVLLYCVNPEFVNNTFPTCRNPSYRVTSVVEEPVSDLNEKESMVVGLLLVIENRPKIIEMTDEDVLPYCINPDYVNTTFPTCPNPSYRVTSVREKPTPRFYTIAPVDFTPDDADDEIPEPYRLPFCVNEHFINASHPDRECLNPTFRPHAEHTEENSESTKVIPSIVQTDNVPIQPANFRGRAPHSARGPAAMSGESERYESAVMMLLGAVVVMFACKAQLGSAEPECKGPKRWRSRGRRARKATRTYMS